MIEDIDGQLTSKFTGSEEVEAVHACPPPRHSGYGVGEDLWRVPCASTESFAETIANITELDHGPPCVSESGT